MSSTASVVENPFVAFDERCKNVVGIARRKRYCWRMRTFEELESLWLAATPSPQRQGRIRLIVARRGDGEHDTPAHAELSVDRGLIGDRWERGKTPKIDAQVTLMNVLAAQLISEDQPLHLAGDNLLVDLDLSEAALPVGARLRVGSAVVELTALPHTGCQKFSARFGQEALRWVNWKAHRDRRLRGVNCRIVAGGTVRVGDSCVVIP